MSIGRGTRWVGKPQSTAGAEQGRTRDRFLRWQSRKSCASVGCPVLASIHEPDATVGSDFFAVL